MDTSVLVVALIIVGLALLFDYTNGFHDAANIVAAMISSGAITARKALIIVGVFEFLGAYFLGTAVAETIGKGIVNPAAISPEVVIGGVIGAIAWNLLTWYRGLPSSSSHALIGGIIGAVIVGPGWQIVDWPTVINIYAVLFASPIIGLMIAFLLTRTCFEAFRNARPVFANAVFTRLQPLSAVALALSHGTNDAQKSMGLITMALAGMYARHPQTIGALYTPDPGGEFVIPRWVIFSCASMIALGMASGGWRIIKTLGGGLYRIRPIHGFTSQLSSAGIVYGSALLGFPVSTTQIASSAILGAGSAQRINAVRWGVVNRFMFTWIITIPASAGISAAVYYVGHWIL